MSDYRLYGPRDFVRQPWKNGLGYTTELLREHIDDDSFAWRLSIARVSQHGPFSSFDGYDRTLVLLAGEGMTLEHAAEATQVLDRPLASARFSGKGPTCATLHDGPIEDFNIMTRSGVCSAQTHTSPDASEFAKTCDASLLLIYACAENIKTRLGKADSLQIPAGHLLRCDLAAPLSVSVQGRMYIVIEIFGLTPVEQAPASI